jgi:hypothetical protein
MSAACSVSAVIGAKLLPTYTAEMNAVTSKLIGKRRRATLPKLSSTRFVPNVGIAMAKTSDLVPCWKGINAMRTDSPVASVATPNAV